ncbi:acyl-CoA dehydrogenase [Streptomyces sp. NPDC058989]|uniref:acyl-CoA dehydrogenase family protein n=1 Tax=Streptomyces sp. NPDC058989 TaxID=3346686 RepID=UPI0036C829EF
MTTRLPPRGELHDLIDGTSPDPLRGRLRAALAATDEPPTADRAERAHRIHRRLRRLADALPPAAELLTDPRRLALLSECVAVADPPLYMAALSHYALCLGSVIALTDDPARLGSQWEALASARSKGVFMVTEIGDASSHLGIRTTAEFDPRTGGFRLGTPDAGAAKFSSVGSSRMPQTAVVCARVLAGGADRGVFSFVVDLTDEHGPLPGVEISRGLELPALPMDYALVRFHDVRLRPEQWLCDRARIDAEGAFHDPLGTADARLQRTLCVGQVLWATLPSAMAAMARECAVQALRFSARRRSHGRLAPGASVLTYRNQQHALLGCLAESFALTCAGRTAREIWTRSRAEAARRGPAEGRADGMTFAPWTAVDRPLAVLKALTVRGTARVAAQCQHRCGVAGFLRPNLLAGYHGFAHAFDSAGGDSELILLDAGRALAAEGAHNGRHAAGRRGGVATAPAVPADHPAWWPAVTRAQEARLAGELHRTLQQRTQAGLAGLELWNPLLDAAGELGEAYGSRLVAESLAGALSAVDDPGLLAVLRPLVALYGAVEARRLAGGLQATGVLSAATVRALPTVLDGLCDRLMPHLPLLEEAMGAAGGTPPAPLGADDYAAALTASLDPLPEGPS